MQLVRPTSGERAEQEHGDIHVAVVGPDELMRAGLEGADPPDERGTSSGCSGGEG